MLTLEEYKTLRGISGDPRGPIGSLLPSVIALIRNYCGRSFTEFYSSNKEEYFSIKWPQKVVFPTEIPVNTIVSVEVKEETTYRALTTDEYLLDSSIDALYYVSSGTPICFPVGINAVKVTYTGGFATTPEDLKLAVADLADYYAGEDWKPEINHTSFTITNAAENGAFPSHIKRVLDLYKNE